jgi:DNA repair photolyase
LPQGARADGSTETVAASGIARLAASSPLADQRRGAEYFLLPVRSVLNRCDSERVPFEWTVNPYRGCEFACRYCYARYTHEFMDLTVEDFERKIFVKDAAGETFSRDLDAHFTEPSLPLFDAQFPDAGSFLRPLPAADAGKKEHIAIGTATDPYQPAEGRFRATRAILTEIARRRNLSVSITTKSNRILEDLDLLVAIASRNDLTVNITITTLDPQLARLLEPRAPHPGLRLGTIRQISWLGLQVGVFVMPILPGITDGEEQLDALARRARKSGARWLGAQAVFLSESSLKVFLPFVEKEFPRVAAQYRRWYSEGMYAPQTYREELSARIAKLRARYRFASRPYVSAP